MLHEKEEQISTTLSNKKNIKTKTILNAGVSMGVVFIYNLSMSYIEHCV